MVDRRAQSPFEDPLTPTNLDAPLLSERSLQQGQPIPVNVQNVQAQPVAVVTRQNSRKAVDAPFALSAPPQRKPVRPRTDANANVNGPSKPVSEGLVPAVPMAPSPATSEILDRPTLPITPTQVTAHIPAIERPTSIRSQAAKVEEVGSRPASVLPAVPIPREAPAPPPKDTKPQSVQATPVVVPTVSVPPAEPSPVEVQPKPISTQEPATSLAVDYLESSSARTSMFVEAPSRTPSSLFDNSDIQNTAPLTISKLEVPEIEDEPDTPSSSVLPEAPSLPVLEHGRPLSLGFGF